MICRKLMPISANTHTSFDLNAITNVNCLNIVCLLVVSILLIYLILDSHYHHLESHLDRMRGSIFPVYKDARRQLILALESSADDTCAAVVSNQREILSNVVMKQDQIHEQYGGIHPLYATQGHMRNISTAISESISRAGVAFGDLDAIATTEGPGMKGCLQIAMVAAKSLVGVSGLPLVGVHHMVGHYIISWILNNLMHYSKRTLSLVV